MHILYVHQYFRTPEQGGAIRSWHIARGMVAAGHKVTMITAHEDPARQETIQGIDVSYLQVPYSNHMSVARRIQAFGQFVQQVKREINTLNGIDLCYLTSTPLTVGLIGLWVKRTKGWPYIFEVRDLWPEAPIQMGAIRFGPMKMILRWLEKRIYDNAERIIALSPGMKAGVLQRSPVASVTMIPNMADLDFFAELPSKQDAEQTLNLLPSFRILYAGTIGKANHLESMIQLADVCQDDVIEWVIIGDGSEKERLQGLAADLPRVRFVDPVDKETIRLFHAASDAVYVSFGPQPVLQTTSPNKFFDGLAAGKLILVNVKGWMKELVEEHACGFYADPAQPLRVREALLAFDAERAGRNGRELAEREFGVGKLVGRVLGVVARRTL